MTLKRQIFDLLQKKEFNSLLNLFDHDPNMVRRYITMATYHTDSADTECSLDENAIEFFRFLSEKRASGNPEYFREIIRRHIWGMNEEGANIDWAAPEIIGAIIAAEPNLFGEFASIMITAAIDEPIFQRGMLKAIKMIGPKNRQLIEYYLPRLKEFTKDKNPELAGLAREVLNELE